MPNPLNLSLDEDSIITNSIHEIFLNFDSYRDVSNVAMRAHDISGLWRLSVLTSLLALVPTAFLWLLPQTAEEQTNLAKSKSRSKLGGFIFIFVLFGSLTWTITEAVLEIVSVWREWSESIPLSNCFHQRYTRTLKIWPKGSHGGHSGMIVGIDRIEVGAHGTHLSHRIIRETVSNLNIVVYSFTSIQTNFSLHCHR